MSLKKFINQIRQEFDVLTGKKGKNKEYSNNHRYRDNDEAREAFEKSKEKLMNVNGWSDMEGINSTFILHDQYGKPADGEARPGYYIKIELPGPKVENWVQITGVQTEADVAEFTVHPSEKPQEKTDPNSEIKHFFAKEASSTFRVERKANVIWAWEIGRNEVINNQESESERPILNTLIAEGGWAGFQKIQWDKLTRYLVHSEDVKTH
jgi:hypothetical protein